jgi:hypothetical protein
MVSSFLDDCQMENAAFFSTLAETLTEPITITPSMMS